MDRDDPCAGRRPTSHERRAGEPWDASYRGDPAPWVIGAPQPAIRRLAAAGGFRGTVLDAGCGTGDNALHLAGLGLHVVGVDVAPTALAAARAQAAARGLDAEFVLADALALDRLGRVFDTVLDSALFHTFDAAERRRYVAGLAAVTRPGGRLHLLCFSDADGGPPGPHTVSEADLRAAFADGGAWRVASVTPERLQTLLADEPAPAWLAEVQRV